MGKRCHIRRKAGPLLWDRVDRATRQGSFARPGGGLWNGNGLARIIVPHLKIHGYAY